VPGKLAPLLSAAPADLRIERLIRAYRTYGHLLADINPISTHQKQTPPDLRLENLGFSPTELKQNFPTNGLMEKPEAPLHEIVELLQEIYCGHIGVEYIGAQNPALEKWLQERIEPTRFKIDLTIEQKKMILQHLNKSELLESFLHTKYVGQKRFSLEGGETLIPMLAAIIETGTTLGLEEFVFGMAHRGRLNVLANILDKSYSQIFSEFDEGYIPVSFEGSGDVKYHKGFSAKKMTSEEKEVNIILSPNPSHLEAVDAVVEGMVYAKQIKNGDVKKERTIPVLVHGDAAISGQGVVYESMQFYNLKGYSCGGTVHIVINNQIGFTTLPRDGRSTFYCTDIARAFCAPVFHVNAENPEDCIFATILALEIRQKFHCDVFIDLNCYRKYGHNEADEPAFTQPLEYSLIRKKSPIREIYRDKLIRQGVLEKQMAEALEEEFKKSLQEELAKGKISEKKQSSEAEEKKEEVFEPVKTAVSKDLLKKIAKKLFAIPQGFNIHPKIEKLAKQRLEMVTQGNHIDWGTAEMLAYATLLWEVVPIRISGQDSCRGTFSHRHALWMDQKVEKEY
jgi:2-oxoglutarate dehydrogenase E1 component